MISLRPATGRSIAGNMMPPSPLYRVNPKTVGKIDFPDSFSFRFSVANAHPPIVTISHDFSVKTGLKLLDVKIGRVNVSCDLSAGSTSTQRRKFEQPNSGHTQI
ncbi:hypothetical protein [Akkermansia sp.]|uniref:hypothetical protein n=1 Tax=Akkermansia sp. TaxID=1872421 RepID=UPI0025C4A3ED|nr:hypothetical protein [Akkermansia sp.]MCC8147586.1 hypothetical protein [Akkermansia sp.]